jgi:hypothetical protein
MEIKNVIENFNSRFGCMIEVKPGEDPILRPDGGTMSWRVHSPEPYSIGLGLEVEVRGWFWVEFVSGNWGCEIELVMGSGGMGVSVKYWYLEEDDAWEGPSNFLFGGARPSNSVVE